VRVDEDGVGKDDLERLVSTVSAGCHPRDAGDLLGEGYAGRGAVSGHEAALGAEESGDSRFGVSVLVCFGSVAALVGDL